MLKRIVVGSAIAGASWYAFYRATSYLKGWGVGEGEASLELPGDDLVAEPSTKDTRSIRIAAPPEAVWPWLVQMGYGRAGWYSYDAMDMKGRSADRILPELQQLEVGDTVPTDPGGGFLVRGLDPGHSLVLYADSELIARRREKGPADDAGPAGLAASGRMLGAGMPEDFAASWAFVIRPDGAGGTLLIERLQVWLGRQTPGSRVVGPVLGTGVVLMTRKQMLGIRDRAEAAGPIQEPVVSQGVEPSNAPSLAADAPAAPEPVHA